MGTNNINIKKYLAQSESKLQETQVKLQQLEQTKQELLQELLRLDGECRVLKELVEDKK